jgi:hypothetical protein
LDAGEWNWRMEMDRGLIAPIVQTLGVYCLLLSTANGQQQSKTPQLEVQAQTR